MLLPEEERESKEGWEGMEDGRGCWGEGRELIAVPDIFLQQAPEPRLSTDAFARMHALSFVVVGFG